MGQRIFPPARLVSDHARQALDRLRPGRLAVPGSGFAGDEGEVFVVVVVSVAIAVSIPVAVKLPVAVLFAALVGEADADLGCLGPPEKVTGAASGPAPAKLLAPTAAPSP